MKKTGMYVDGNENGDKEGREGEREKKKLMPVKDRREMKRRSWRTRRKERRKGGGRVGGKLKSACIPHHVHL